MGSDAAFAGYAHPLNPCPSQAPTLQTYVVYAVESRAVSTLPLFRHVLVSRPSGGGEYGMRSLTGIV